LIWCIERIPELQRRLEEVEKLKPEVTVRRDMSEPYCNGIQVSIFLSDVLVMRERNSHRMWKWVAEDLIEKLDNEINKHS
jgi:hypothetical protein